MNKKQKTGRTAGVIFIVLAFAGLMFGGSWYKMENLKAEAAKEIPQIRLPENEELNKITHETMGRFADGVKKNDFTEFFSAVAKQWQQQTDAKAMAEAFKDFTEKKVDLDYVKTSQPAFTAAPTIDKKGILTVIGHYPSKKTDLQFTLKFGYEGAEWKLHSINAELK